MAGKSGKGDQRKKQVPSRTPSGRAAGTGGAGSRLMERWPRLAVPAPAVRPRLSLPPICKACTTSSWSRTGRKPMGMFASSSSRDKLPSEGDDPASDLWRKPLKDLGRDLLRRVIVRIGEDRVDRQTRTLHQPSA